MIRTGALIFAAIAFFANGSIGSAQVAAARPGITVLGRGSVKRTADILRFTIVVSNNGGRGSPADALAGADALVTTLKAGGVDDATISNPLNGMLTAQRFLSITGSIHKPTLDKIRTLLGATVVAVPNNAIIIQSVNTSLGLDDCTAALDSAEKAAMQDAREHARRLAGDANLTLGPVTAIAAFDNGSNGACPTKPDRVFPAGQGVDILQSSTVLEVVLSTSETVTFEAH